MTKLFVSIFALCNLFSLGAGFWFLQVVPSSGSPLQDTTAAYLISAIIAESSVIIFLALYARSLNKIIKATVEKVYEQQIADQKEVIAKNTAAFIENTASNKSLIDSHREIAKATTELRLWLSEKFSNKRE